MCRNWRCPSVIQPMYKTHGVAQESKIYLAVICLFTVYVSIIMYIYIALHLQLHISSYLYTSIYLCIFIYLSIIRTDISVIQIYLTVSLIFLDRTLKALAKGIKLHSSEHDVYIYASGEPLKWTIKSWCGVCEPQCVCL